MSIRRRTVVQGLAAAAVAAMRPRLARSQSMTDIADTILLNGRITTLDRAKPDAEAIAIRDGLVAATGTEAELMRLASDGTEVIDLGGRRVIPGLNDSHTHLIRGGLNFNLELRWEGVPSLADALRMLRDQATRTPPPQWVRVMGVSQPRWSGPT